MTNLKPIDRFELNRMIHARAQELPLPGSPAGKNGHPQLSMAARQHFGVSSFSHVTDHQMRMLYDFLDKHHRLPRPGEELTPLPSRSHQHIAPPEQG